MLRDPRARFLRGDEDHAVIARVPRVSVPPQHPAPQRPRGPHRTHRVGRTPHLTQTRQRQPAGTADAQPVRIPAFPQENVLGNPTERKSAQPSVRDHRRRGPTRPRQQMLWPATTV
ncbi:hypothetical protein GCM10010446_19700 [Streptomyces enissocaesilis]|uniref:Uncharacterized protein n=1 Tax=Streptomyces enissocaesilis TaxID=332589 RepID=A0ABN3X456_9ACTN